MKTKALLFLAFNAVAFSLFAQNGNVGIGTTTPGSKLTVNGSFAATYNNVSGNYSMTGNDYYLAWNDTIAGTVTLPAALALGSGNFQGRVYHIKNTGSANLTVAANGSELMDNQSGAGVANLTLAPGYYAMIVSKGTTTGTTWEVAIQTGIMTGLFNANSATAQTIAAGGTAVMTYGTEVLDENSDFDPVTGVLTVTPASAGVWALHVHQQGDNNPSSSSSNFNFRIQRSIDGGANWATFAGGSGTGVAGNQSNGANIDVIARLNAGDKLRVTTTICIGCTATSMSFTGKLFWGIRLR